MLDSSKQTPKYFRIMQEIIAEIRSGSLVPGARIISENEVIEAYEVSNTTARRVLLELERGGWVRRVKGKGTYVCDNRVDRSATRILGFTKNMVQARRVPSTQLISVKIRRRSRKLIISGRQYHLPGPICEIKRLRLADGIPMMRETRYISNKLCPGIRKKDLAGSLYDIYERDFNLQLVQIDQELSAIIVDGREIGFPGVEGQIPAFCVKGVTSCAKELILEMEESIYRGDMYRFTVRATR